MLRWRDISIAKKLYFVIGTMALLIVCELGTLKFAMGILSAVRAFVGGEGLWSKAQKNAAFRLQRFAVTRNEEDFQAFLEYLKIPEGDHLARIELQKKNPNFETVHRGFVQGGIHPDDTDSMVRLLQNFSWERHLARAIDIWADGDRVMAEFKKEGLRYHELLAAKKKSPSEIMIASDHLRSLNEQLTAIEDEFSSVLGEGSRWMDRVVILLLLTAVLLVEGVGLTLTFLTSRSISRNLSEINSVAGKIGQGDFSRRLVQKSGDEIGRLAGSIENMRLLLEKSYRDLERRVQERTSDLEQFTIFASHDLKEPLRTISVWLELLEKDLGPKLDASHKEHMHFIADAARRMKNLIDGLLAYGQIGKRATVFEIVDCSTEVSRVLDLLRLEIDRLGAKIHLVPLPSVWADRVLLGEIFQNLISNALKYHGKDAPEIYIQASDSADFWIFSIRDNGIGFSKQDADRIFHIFQRLGDGEGISGSGIGLALCRKIVELHGGRIWAESDLGQGATFFFSLSKRRLGT